MDKRNLTLELPNFEGPLDLLLHLIQSQKIDIYDIPIAQITSQYLDYLRQMQQLNLQIAGEYFVMSSTLLRIKSQYLLPQNDFVDDVEPEEDPRDELVQQLIQYSVFKKISAYFKERNEEVPITVSKEASVSKSIKVQPLPKGQITSKELAATFSMVLKRLKIRKPNTASIKIAETPINDMINYLNRRLKRRKQVSFFSCADQMQNISDVIGLFLAMLELCKKHEIHIIQAREFGDLDLERIDGNGK
ncbi:segregation and condensation protein A [Lactobacillus ultunensis]|uniref:Segregation and condensation protein A n=1 Tax=Lactobacillus ultunensis DSM 16047 TaxID=525365 RepID=C2EMW2_9LACO|nr:segregation/condensation protein A [Lactobacillus ultunensis]EEJ72131.1 ScpA/B protein [Lactobacillus ultunensis DSM 16047]KRL80902.1 segregation and condensation protein [Lactobacillus ultunensis DSM 16047]QQP27753.1 segregation/condensation protein A [Lactobacillus ultunensis]